METLPRLILLKGGRDDPADTERTQRPFSGESAYRVDYSHLWRLPPPLPPRGLPWHPLIVLAVVLILALSGALFDMLDQTARR